MSPLRSSCFGGPPRRSPLACGSPRNARESRMPVASGSDPPPGSSGSWIGLAPTPAGIAALLTVGTVGMMITGVQPVVFGALVREGRLSVAELGQATTAEFLALGIGVLVAGAVIRPRHLRW